MVINQPFSVGMLRLDIKYCGREILHALADGRLTPTLADENGHALLVTLARYKNPLRNNRGGIFMQFHRPISTKVQFGLRKVALAKIINT